MAGLGGDKINYHEYLQMLLQPAGRENFYDFCYLYNDCSLSLHSALENSAALPQIPGAHAGQHLTLPQVAHWELLY